MLKQENKMNKRNLLNLGEALCLAGAVYFICHVLRQDNIVPISISSVWAYISHWAKHFHVIAAGLLPVYVALMVFGTAIGSLYLGSAIQRWITRFLHSK